MSATALVSILCPDRTGLIAAVAGRLYDLGVNLGDTTFAVLGGGAEFTSLCELPQGVSPQTIERDLKGLPELEGGKVTVAPFSLPDVHGPSARITHRIEIAGRDMPGLIARVAEAFNEFGANIVRMNSERTPGSGATLYVTRISAWIPEGKTEACLATVANTSAQMNLTCKFMPV
ncbi:MAG TPA: ACT domain-containing protein [Alphaproteobacteria bacterium]|nr:ACT domain-containing protein [Alphaproteobacteria bacterium]